MSLQMSVLPSSAARLTLTHVQSKIFARLLKCYLGEGSLGLNMILLNAKYIQYQRRVIVNKYKTYETMIAQNNLPHKMISAMVD